jgi:hypothetical protein
MSAFTLSDDDAVLAAAHSVVSDYEFTCTVSDGTRVAIVGRRRNRARPGSASRVGIDGLEAIGD